MVKENDENKKRNIPSKKGPKKNKYEQPKIKKIVTVMMEIKYLKKIIIFVLILKIIQEFHQRKMIGKQMTCKAREL